MTFLNVITIVFYVFSCQCGWKPYTGPQQKLYYDYNTKKMQIKNKKSLFWFNTSYI